MPLRSVDVVQVPQLRISSRTFSKHWKISAFAITRTCFVNNTVGMNRMKKWKTSAFQLAMKLPTILLSRNSISTRTLSAMKIVLHPWWKMRQFVLCLGARKKSRFSSTFTTAQWKYQSTLKLICTITFWFFSATPVVLLDSFSELQ